MFTYIMNINFSNYFAALSSSTTIIIAVVTAALVLIAGAFAFITKKKKAKKKNEATTKDTALTEQNKKEEEFFEEHEEPNVSTEIIEVKETVNIKKIAPKHEKAKPVIEEKHFSPEENAKLTVLKRIFVNRLYQAEGELKKNYSLLKNELLSYVGVKSTITAPCDTFKTNKELIAKVNIDGKKLIVYLKLDPAMPDYNDGTCPHRDMGHKIMYSEVPFRFTITSGLALRRCIKLISDMASNLGLEKNTAFKKTDYVALYPHLSDEELLNFDKTPLTPVIVKKTKDIISEENVSQSVEKEVAASVMDVQETTIPIVNRKTVGKEGNIDILKRVFVNRLCQAEAELKENYSALKNELLSYRGVKSRLSAPCDTFRANKEEICKINIDGRKLIVYLSLDPNNPDYNDGTCPHRDMGHKYMYESVPFRFTITSGLALRRAIKLISDMMTNYNYIKNPRYKTVDFAALYPYMDDAMLLSKFNGQ